MKVKKVTAEDIRRKSYKRDKETLSDKMFRSIEDNCDWFFAKDVRGFIQFEKARRENQLKIHWNWLKNKPYEEVVKFLNAITNKLVGGKLINHSPQTKQTFQKESGDVLVKDSIISGESTKVKTEDTSKGCGKVYGKYEEKKCGCNCTNCNNELCPACSESWRDKYDD